jgi:hypothetical protein
MMVFLFRLPFQRLRLDSRVPLIVWKEPEILSSIKHGAVLSCCPPRIALFPHLALQRNRNVYSPGVVFIVFHGENGQNAVVPYHENLKVDNWTAGASPNNI